MRHTIAKFICNCDTCTHIKVVHHAPYGLLKTLEVPFQHWSFVSLDLITGLLLSNRLDAFLVVVYCLSKMTHYIPTTTDITSKGIVRLFFDNIFRLHGIPYSIISDRGTQFTPDFTHALANLVRTQQKLSAIFHPQIAGQTERINAIVEQYLCRYCNYQ